MQDIPLLDQLRLSNQVKNLIKMFNDFIKEIQKTNWKETIVEASNYFNIRQCNLKNLTPVKVKELYRNLAIKFYNEQQIKTIWHENQLRLFAWVFITFSGLKKKKTDLLEMDDWIQISNLFMKKSPEICQFYYYSLKKFNQKKQNKWSIRQDKMLIDIVNHNQFKNKWNDIAKQIYYRSNYIFFRTGRQCRQRWNNYLDPSKIKGNWTKQQDLKLIQIVITQGKKWSRIAKQQLKNTRTEHMVKNRYKSLLAKQSKKCGKSKNYYNQNFLLQKIQKSLMALRKKEQKISECKFKRQYKQQYVQHKQQYVQHKQQYFQHKHPQKIENQHISLHYKIKNQNDAIKNQNDIVVKNQNDAIVKNQNGAVVKNQNDAVVKNQNEVNIKNQNNVIVKNQNNVTVKLQDNQIIEFNPLNVISNQNQFLNTQFYLNGLKLFQYAVKIQKIQDNLDIKLQDTNDLAYNNKNINNFYDFNIGNDYPYCP